MKSERYVKGEEKGSVGSKWKKSFINMWEWSFGESFLNKYCTLRNFHDGCSTLLGDEASAEVDFMCVIWLCFNYTLCLYFKFFSHLEGAA